MRRFTRRLALLLAVFMLVPVLGCGSGSGGSGNLGTKGALIWALSYLRNPLGGQSQILGLKNMTGKDTTVDVTAFAMDGTSPFGTVTVPVPAHNEVRTPITDYTGVIGGGFEIADFPGWLEIDTTGTPAEGFIFAYMDRANGITEGSDNGLAFRADAVGVAFDGMTDSFQIINAASDDPGGADTPFDIDFDVELFDPLGISLGVTTETIVGDGALEIPVAPTFVGMVMVTPVAAGGGGAIPPTVELRHSVTALQCDLKVQIEARYLEVEDTFLEDIAAGFDLSFGRELNGTVNDFGLLISNDSDSNQTVRIDQITLENGTQLLNQPRIVGLLPYATKFLTSQNATSVGLETNEQSPFNDLFGDVAARTPGDNTRFFIQLVSPESVYTSARHFDPLFNQHYRLVRFNQLTPRIKVGNLPIQLTTATGTRNWVDMMNPFNNDIEVFIRGFTPGGTEYILPSVIVPANERFRWSPDGLQFTEDPGEPIPPGTPVKFMCFDLSATGGIFYNARKTRRDPLPLPQVQVRRETPYSNRAFE